MQKEGGPGMERAAQLTAAVTAAAVFLAERFSDDELALLAAIFVQLGDSIATILAQKALEGRTDR